MTSKTPVEPKDLGLKIGSKKETRWTQIRDRAKQEITQAEDMIVVNTAIIAVAEGIIEKEKKTFK